MAPKANKESSPKTSRAGRVLKTPSRFVQQCMEENSTRRSGLLRSKANEKSSGGVTTGTSGDSKKSVMAPTKGNSKVSNVSSTKRSSAKHTATVTVPAGTSNNPPPLNNIGSPSSASQGSAVVDTSNPAANGVKNQLFSKLMDELTSIKDGQKVIHQKIDQLEETVKEASWIEEGKFRDMRRHMNRFQDDMHGKMDQIYGELTGYRDDYTRSAHLSTQDDHEDNEEEIDWDQPGPSYIVKQPVASRRRSSLLNIPEEEEDDSE